MIQTFKFQSARNSDTLTQIWAIRHIGPIDEKWL
jgi:hypothetical protein